MIKLYENIQGGFNLYIQSGNTFRKCNKKPIKSFDLIKEDEPLQVNDYFFNLFKKRDFEKIENLIDFLKTT